MIAHLALYDNEMHALVEASAYHLDYEQEECGIALSGCKEDIEQFLDDFNLNDDVVYVEE